jgi:hypothetical protein
VSEESARFFLIVDDENVISCVPVSKQAGEERLAELQAVYMRGSYGQRRSFRLVEVDASTYEAAVHRRIYYYRPPAR